MSWRVYGERLDTADMSGTPRVYQPFTLSKSMKVKAIRTWFVYFNSPSFTGLYLDIYSNKSGSPKQRVWRSDKCWTGSEISATDAYAAKELYFDFDDSIWLKAGEYHFAPYASSYTGTSASHLAWMRAFYGIQNSTDITINTKNGGSIPYYIGLIDGDL